MQIVFSPTCQVRVVRFYKSCPSPSSPSSPSSSSSPSSPSSPSPPRPPPLCRHLRHHLRQQYVAMRSARSQLQAADRSGQRRTSTGSSRLQWAAPGLNRGAPERSGQRRTSPAKKKMPEDMSEKNVRRHVRK